MNMVDNNTSLVDFQGNFRIQYVAEDNLSRLNTYYRLPLTTRIMLGNQALGLNGTEYQSVGYSFSPADYLREVISIQKGEKRTINLHERYPVPITFSPFGANCLIKLERDQLGEYVSFDKNKVEDQVVSLDETVFRLANIMNGFLFDLDEKKIYPLLDELEEEISPLLSGTDLRKIWDQHTIMPYQFNKAKSTQRVFSTLRDKQMVSQDYSVFIDSLTYRQSRGWNDVLRGLRDIDSTKSDEELYYSAKIKPQVHANQ